MGRVFSVLDRHRQVSISVGLFNENNVIPVLGPKSYQQQHLDRHVVIKESSLNLIAALPVLDHQ